ncbi:phage late control D family protein [Candidatus Zixiibacteriota bacterium]
MARYPQYAPAYDIRINDADLPPVLRSSISGVRYMDGVNAADRVELSFANAELRWLQNHIRGLGFRPFPTGVKIGPIKGPSVVPEGTFDLDNKFSLAMGYAPDPLEEMFLGEVTGIQASFPNGGMPAMTLVAHDYLNRLAQGSYARGFGPLHDALVVMILSAENLLIPLIDPTIPALSSALAAVNIVFNGTGAKQGARCQGQSDLALLTSIAAKYDADFWVDGNVLYLSRFMKEYTPRLSLTWGESLLDFTPKVSTVGQVAGVSMKFTLRELPLNFLVTMYYDFDRETVGISVVPGEAAAGAKMFSGPSFTIVDKPISSPADIANSALVILSKLRKKLNNRLTGSGSAIGDPRIRAGAVIRLEGLGPDFSGDYRVASATHSIDGSGYRTSFEVKKEIIP